MREVRRMRAFMPRWRDQERQREHPDAKKTYKSRRLSVNRIIRLSLEFIPLITILEVMFMSIREEVIEALCKKAATLFGKDPASLGPETRFIEDLQAKSVDMVKFSALLEDVYEVEVPFMEFVKKLTFDDAAKYIAEMLGE